MLAQGALDALHGQQTPLTRLLARPPPLKLGFLMMDIRVPNEIYIESPLEILALLLTAVPHAQPFPVKRLLFGDN
jgi:hypothetical protein